MKRPHAPKTGVGNSAGLKPPAVSTSQTAHPKNSAGKNSGTDRSGDKGSSHASGKAGNHAMMRKPSYR